jgi:hypothetical protein
VINEGGHSRATAGSILRRGHTLAVAPEASVQALDIAHDLLVRHETALPHVVEPPFEALHNRQFLGHEVLQRLARNCLGRDAGPSREPSQPILRLLRELKFQNPHRKLRLSLVQARRPGYAIALSTFPIFSTSSPISSFVITSGGDSAMVSPAMRIMRPNSWKPRSIAS